MRPPEDGRVHQAELQPHTAREGQGGEGPVVAVPEWDQQGAGGGSHVSAHRGGVRVQQTLPLPPICSTDQAQLASSSWRETDGGEFLSDGDRSLPQVQREKVTAVKVG